MKLTRRTLIKAGASAIAFPTIISRSSAQDAKQLHVGVYNSALGKLVQKDVIPKFEAEFKCRVFTIEGATLSNIAALRATRDTPRFSMMMMDDVGIPQAKQEGLIDKLDAGKIPNLEKVYQRYLFEDGYGVGFSISSAAMFINPQVTKPLESYEQIFDAKYRKQILLNTPKNTQSVLMLIVATALTTGKPLRVNDDCLETHGPTGALDAKCDLAAVGDQDLVEHQDEPAGPIRNRACPASISSPSPARIASTIPGASAAMSMKVFIASMMQIFCPASMLAPTSTSGGSSGAAAR
jgi:hypothetical protein